MFHLTELMWLSGGKEGILSELRCVVYDILHNSAVLKFTLD